jgi:hypothetical protein
VYPERQKLLVAKGTIAPPQPTNRAGL